ncbi:hypothetical protein ACFOWE_31185 [Planomonospora corallina]|uniref:Uncharacterized protein n=1 Tax=Planomonospora corallina TaxID=1806052 RepID=A0ABV8IFH7_9ACTN
MSVPRLLAELALAELDGADRRLPIGERRAMAREIAMATRQLRAAGATLTQLAAAVDAGLALEQRQQVLATLEAVGRAAERLEAAAVVLAGRAGGGER